MFTIMMFTVNKGKKNSAESAGAMHVIHAYCICPQVLTWATTSGDKYTISIVTISIISLKKSAEWSSTFIAPICELSLWAKSCSVTTRPHQNVLLKMKLHDLNCMKHRVMWWSDVVSCAGCACSCRTQDHKCPVTVKTYYLCMFICLNGQTIIFH